MPSQADPRRAKPGKNPRSFASPHAAIVGSMALVALFASLCFEFGNGRFGAGISPALAYVAFPPFGFSLLLVGALAAGLGLLAGRWIGTTRTRIAAGSLLVASVIYSGKTSQPLGRFRRLVWADAPDTIQPIDCEALHSFGDGTVRFFSFSATPDLVVRMNASIGLAKTPPVDGIAPRPRIKGIAGRTFPTDSEFYKQGNIELAYSPSEQEAVVAVFP